MFPFARWAFLVDKFLTEGSKCKNTIICYSIGVFGYHAIGQRTKFLGKNYLCVIIPYIIIF